MALNLNFTSMSFEEELEIYDQLELDVECEEDRKCPDTVLDCNLNGTSTTSSIMITGAFIFLHKIKPDAINIHYYIVYS